MPLATCRLKVLAAASLLFVASPARAQDPEKPPPHVRPESESTRELVALAVTRSPTVREMVERIERSNVVVYIRHRSFPSLLQGQIGVLSTVAGRRYLIVEIACGRISTEQISTLGHELYHALEIAGNPSVVNTQSLASFYEHFGTRTSGHSSGATYETAGARAAGFQVRREAFTSQGKLAEEQ